jgi:hypothetical protein
VRARRGKVALVLVERGGHGRRRGGCRLELAAAACACCGDLVETMTSPAHGLLPSPLRPLDPKNLVALPHSDENMLAGGRTATVHGGWLHRGPLAPTSRPTGTMAPPGACQLGPGSTGAQGSTATPIAAAQPRRRARIPAKLGPEPANKYLLHHLCIAQTLPSHLKLA